MPGTGKFFEALLRGQTPQRAGVISVVAIRCMG